MSKTIAQLPAETAPANNDVLAIHDVSSGQTKKITVEDLGLAADQTPTGTVAAFAGSSAPSGWLICDGTAVSRTTYATLFALIGTTYGAGNGTTTFNIPNLKGKVIVGLDGADASWDTLGETGGAKTVNLQHSHTASTGSHGLTQSEMPVHSHGVNDPGHTHTYQGSSNVLVGGSTRYAGGDSAGTSDASILNSTTGISIQNAGGGNGHSHSISNDLTTTQSILQPYMALNYMIHY